MDWSEVTDYLRDHGKETFMLVAMLVFIVWFVITLWNSGMVDQLLNTVKSTDISSIKDIAK